VRRPSLSTAGADLVFAALALTAGCLGAGALAAALIFAAAVATWTWTRRRTLAAMPFAQRVTNSVLALAVLAVVLGGSYWIGHMLGGHK
jgi:hypothetical protein